MFGEQKRYAKTVESKKAPCIVTAHVNPNFWKSIENNNRANERRIGRLKRVVNKQVHDDLNEMDVTDLRLRAFLCNTD